LVIIEKEFLKLVPANAKDREMLARETFVTEWFETLGLTFTSKKVIQRHSGEVMRCIGHDSTSKSPIEVISETYVFENKIIMLAVMSETSGVTTKATVVRFFDSFRIPESTHK
jgi:hypothetical protein